MSSHSSTFRIPHAVTNAKVFTKVGQTVLISFLNESIIDRGTFGVVYKAKINNKTFAVKKVYQDPHYRNREVDILSVLNHRNIVDLHYYYFDISGSEKYLLMFMDFIPTSVGKIIARNRKRSLALSLKQIKLFMYQMFVGLNYMHSLNILHRDIKPSNLLVDPTLGILKICDFGNAKKIIKDQPSIDYICSRYYRAPELIFGAVIYSSAVDVWSGGCVLAECFLTDPIFKGANSEGQLVSIVQVLGTPSADDLAAMKQRKNNKFVHNKYRVDLNTVMNLTEGRDVLTILDSIFQYDPALRPTAKDVCKSDYFSVLFEDADRFNLEIFE